jgi:uncharacterized protein
LRCVLAAKWIAQYQTIPPMEIRKLLPLIHDKSLLAHIFKLIDLKMIKDESYEHPQETHLQEYLMEMIIQCDSIASQLPTSKPNIDQINTFFRKVIKHEY